MSRTTFEHRTGYLIIGNLQRRATSALIALLETLICLEFLPIRTITAEDDTELHSYKAVEQRVPVKFSVAKPHQSWERGSVSGLTPKYLPKGVSTERLTQAVYDRFAAKPNSRACKRFGLRIPT